MNGFLPFRLEGAADVTSVTAYVKHHPRTGPYVCQLRFRTQEAGVLPRTSLALYAQPYIYNSIVGHDPDAAEAISYALGRASYRASACVHLGDVLVSMFWSDTHTFDVTVRLYDAPRTAPKVYTV